MQKKTLLIAGIIAIVAIGMAIIFLTGPKECAEMDEEECRMADECISTIVPVPCETEPCELRTEFKECKAKTE
ncbi:MAG: hypothetical protein WC505_03830 [Patescibacteria group bacterium]